MSKNVIITGTSRGIGYALALDFARAGHQVLALSRDESPINELKDDNIDSFSFDITRPEAHQEVSDYIDKHWDAVDILVNNAGYFVKNDFLQLDLEDFRKSYEVNVFGVVRLTQIVLPRMRKQAHVLNISSMGGVQGSVKFGGLSAYSSSKAAIITLNELLAEEYKGQGVSFNTLALGAVQTEMLEEAFPGYEAPVSAEEMAAYIMEFALSGHKFYNGKVLPVAVNTP